MNLTPSPDFRHDPARLPPRSAPEVRFSAVSASSWEGEAPFSPLSPFFQPAGLSIGSSGGLHPKSKVLAV